MTVTKRQFTLLNAMGIDLWCSRSASKELDIEHTETAEKYLDINLDILKDSALFNDILLSVNLSVAEINFQENMLDLGLFNWAFSPEKEITFKQNRLTTPDMDTLASSPKLKSQLWQAICEQKIT